MGGGIRFAFAGFGRAGYPVLEKLVFGQYIEENTCF